MYTHLTSALSRLNARLSTRTKLVLIAAAIGVTAGSFISWSVIHEQSAQIRGDFEQRALLVAHTVEAFTTTRAQPTTDEGRLGQLVGLQLDIESLMKRETSILEINVYAEHQGRSIVIGSSERALLGTNPSSEARLDLTTLGTTTLLTEGTQVRGQDALEVVAPLNIAGQPPLAIGVYVSTAERDKALGAVAHTFARTILIAIVLGVLFVYVMAWLLISRPLQRLLRAAKRVRDGDYTTRIPGSPSPNAADEIVRLSAHFNVMAESIEQLYEETKALASTDSLTGLYNRRYFLEALQRVMERARRDGRPLAAVMLDLDGFKAVNDRYGHTVGDAALLHVAHALSRSARAGDLTARFGGDEFVVLLPNCDGASLQAVMERIRQGVADLDPPRAGDDTTIRITVSAGGALFRDNDTLDSLMQRADLALFEAKHAGRNQVRVAA